MEPQESSNRPPPGGTAFDVAEVSWVGSAAALLAVREAVFVCEQGVPPALERDALDALATHFLARAATGAPIGTARLLPDAHIGRLAVLPAWRGRGVGRALLERAVAAAAARGMREVVLHAQVHAQGFYAAAGFTVEGGEFLEAGIRHVRMRRTMRD
jgi:predicted GNAT family N-acyltransferase